MGNGFRTAVSEYVRGDSCYAVIDGHNGRGSYLKLDNGQRAFSYNAGNLRNGVKIICTIAKTATADRDALAKMDSICGLYDACA